MAEVKRIVHLWGIQLFQYLDDWLIQASSKDLCALHTRRVLALCDQMGLLVNHRKSALVPTQEFVFLGYDFCLATFLCFPPQKRMQKIWDLIREIIRRRGAQARIWQVLLGLLASSEKMVPLGRLHMREIHFSLRACWDFDLLTSNQFVPLSPLAHSDLSWWMWEYNVFQGSPIVHPDPTAHFLTDASQLGWGAHWGMRTISGRWTPEEA